MFKSWVQVELDVVTKNIQNRAMADDIWDIIDAHHFAKMLGIGLLYN